MITIAHPEHSSGELIIQTLTSECTWCNNVWMDRHTDVQGETIKPCHYRVEGNKNESLDGINFPS